MGGSLSCTMPESCPMDLPYCNVEDNMCVECLQDGACDKERSRCEPVTHKCVQCVGDDDCREPTAKCDSTSHTCVDCLLTQDCSDPEQPSCRAGKCGDCSENEDCAHFPTRKLCGSRDSSTPGACVECVQHRDCMDPKKPQCTAGTCEPCGGRAADDACAGHRGATVCETAEGSRKGSCVECTVKNEAACGDFVCDVQKSACSKQLKASAEACETCIADTQCMTDHRCVPVEFENKARGNYCLKRLSTGCIEPFTIEVGAMSLSGGRPENYCGINGDVTTCEAVRALLDNADCSNDNDCGAKLGDGLCRTVGGRDNKCTYACGVTGQCPMGLRCSAGVCQ
jgi:hypothetical protein